MMRSFSSCLRRLAAALAVGAAVFAVALAVAHAETHIDNGFIHGDAAWDESGSPYIVSDPVTIPEGSSLIIGPGVSVVGTEDVDGYNLLDAEGGSLMISGTPGKRVALSGYGGITLDSGATSTILDTDISLPDGVIVHDSSLTMASATVMNASQAFRIGSASVDISDSRITNNDAGVLVESSAPPTIIPMAMTSDGFPASGGSNPSSDVKVVGSDIALNKGAAIENDDSAPVQATDDWWGSDAGPAFDGPNSLTGQVQYEPWQKRASAPPCCSSVLFIPGIEASRIYSERPGPFGVGTTTDRGWEPLSNSAAKTIYLNPDGTSVNPDTYSGDPIDAAYGFVDIYGTFMRFLASLAAKGTIGDWKAFGYDWRKPIAEVVAGQEKKATSTESLIGTVMAMASSSKTGKVTIVAHSNGGLVAKYLVKTLADLGKADLIDKVISVAVPYLGTPLAIPSVLYGDGSSIGDGILLKQSVAQKLGVNMPSAYSLLPSATYFSQMLGPTIAYASGTSTSVNDPSSQDSLVGSKANKALMTAAESLHRILDPFEWPAAIGRFALVGWGNATLQSMVYAKPGSNARTASTTMLGDGTVIAGSAAYNAGTTTALDLSIIGARESKSYDHKNILDASSTEQVIEDIIEDKAAPDTLDRILGVSTGLPSVTVATRRIVVSTHSPVDLHVYDSHGDHTGVIPAPAGSGVADDVVTFYEEKIPGSRFAQNGGDGEDDPDTEISLPADSDQTYSIQIQGNGVGEFTYEVQRFDGDELQSDTTYSGLLTTPLTVASTTIDSNASASSSALLSVDVDGDGAIDLSAKPNSSLDPISFFEALKRSIASLLGPKAKRANDMSARIDRIETLFKKDKTKKVVNKLNQLEAALGHKKSKSLTQNDKDGIIDLVDSFLKNYENQ